MLKGFNPFIGSLGLEFCGINVGVLPLLLRLKILFLYYILSDCSGRLIDPPWLFSGSLLLRDTLNPEYCADFWGPGPIIIIKYYYLLCPWGLLKEEFNLSWDC